MAVALAVHLLLGSGDQFREEPCTKVPEGSSQHCLNHDH